MLDDTGREEPDESDSWLVRVSFLGFEDFHRLMVTTLEEHVTPGFAEGLIDETDCEQQLNEEFYGLHNVRTTVAAAKRFVLLTDPELVPDGAMP